MRSGSTAGSCRMKGREFIISERKRERVDWIVQELHVWTESRENIWQDHLIDFQISRVHLLLKIALRMTMTDKSQVIQCLSKQVSLKHQLPKT